MQVCTSLQTDNHASTKPLKSTETYHFVFGEISMTAKKLMTLREQ